MRRCALALVLLTGCDDEVVGFAEAASTGVVEMTSSSTTEVGDATSGSSEGSTGGSSEGSSSTGAGFPDGLPRYVSYGFDGGLAASWDDGLNWSDIPDPIGMEEREDLAGGEDSIVIVGAFDAAVTYDGVTWEHADVDDLGYARGVAYGAGGFAAVGLDHLAWSLDGLTWEDARGGSTGFDFTDVAYANGRFVAVGEGQIATSENGQNWTVTTIGGEKLRSVTFGDGKFVAVSELGRVLETADGETLLRDDLTGLGPFGEVHFCNDTFVIGGNGRIWVSPDADALEEREYPNDGAFACTNATTVVVKAEGLFRGPGLEPLDLVHAPSQPHYKVHLTGF